MKTSAIRTSFLDYFKGKGHTVVESSSLVPHNDPTLLFTNAGMVQFKDVFLGKDPRSYKRAASVQKCLRAGGKHNDLENVGFTARHHTFFEMLGNFSFGDYFKEEAIAYGWEYVTQVLHLPTENLYVTVFRDDDEAAKIWQKKIGLAQSRVFRMGEKDNFWAMGDTGPCGPCSEIFVDRGEKYGCGKPSCAVGCDCDRYMEIWNLVFMQFERDTKGKLSPLPKPSIDTGAGLERMASVLQKVDSNYDIDIFRSIIQQTQTMLAQKVAPESSASLRVIADHARAATFLISDGVLPSNEGRGYVLRRIIRRAVRHGKKIGFEEPFLAKVCGYVVEQMQAAYPYLKNQAQLLGQCVFAEEEQFLKTLELGLNLLSQETTKLKKGAVVSGDVAFKLYDTYGFPFDLTRVIAEEQGLQVDEQGFEHAMQGQRDRSRKNWKGSGEASVDNVYHATYQQLKGKNKLPRFVGYEELDCEAECVAAWSGSEANMWEAVFLKTPFYAEGGGQVADQGKVTAAGFEADVTHVQKPVHDLVVIGLRIRSGALRVGQSYRQSVAGEPRILTAKNHTATHLLHWALRKVLGDHVKQAGSLVNAELLRFDFTHFQALKAEELQAVEELINEKIWHGDVVAKREMGKDAAIQAGAIAFFGEKYGDKVRVVSVGDYSVELCGGTHVNSSSEINLFKIISESSIASGVRRITAYTGKQAFLYLRERELESRLIRDKLKAATTADVESKLDKMAAVEKDLRRKLDEFQSAGLANEAQALLDSTVNFDGFQAVLSLCEDDGTGVKRLRELTDRIRQRNPKVVVVMGMRVEDKAFISAAVGKDLLQRVSAHAIIQELAPLIAGRGGGKADMAQAGGSDMTGLSKALDKAKDYLNKIH